MFSVLFMQMVIPIHVVASMRRRGSESAISAVELRTREQALVHNGVFDIHHKEKRRMTARGR